MLLPASFFLGEDTEVDAVVFEGVGMRAGEEAISFAKLSVSFVALGMLD